MMRDTVTWVFAGALSACAAMPSAVLAAEHLQADCTAAARDTPTLDPKVLPSARFRMVETVIGSARHDGKVVDLYLWAGEETAQLTPQVKLTISLGGCETYSNVYRFTIPRQQAALTDGDFWLKTSADLIALVAPANLDTSVDLAKLRKALPKAAQTAPGSFEGAVSGADTTFGVDVVQSPNGAEVTVSYRIAL